MIVCKEKESDKNETFSDAYLSMKTKSSKLSHVLVMMLAKTHNIWKRNPQNFFFFAGKNGITSEEEINKKILSILR